MNAQREAMEVIGLLAIKVEHSELSREDLCQAIDRSTQWLDDVFHGRSGLTLEEFFSLLRALDEDPGEFFAAHYDMYCTEKLGKELAPGVFAGPVNRFVEEVAQRAVTLERDRTGETDR
ncbi:MAG: hypothetical protein AAF604_14180 [Acidobacteriota bacterium]